MVLNYKWHKATPPDIHGHIITSKLTSDADPKFTSAYSNST